MDHIAKHKIDFSYINLRDDIDRSKVEIDYDKTTALNTNWKKYSLEKCELVQELKTFYQDILGCKVSPLYYVQLAGDRVEKHIDTSCKSSINIILNDGSHAPINFYQGDEKYMYFYRCALLNVGGYYHDVPVSHTDRLVLRFALQAPFEDARNKLKEGVMYESS